MIVSLIYGNVIEKGCVAAVMRQINEELGLELGWERGKRKIGGTDELLSPG